MSNIARFKEIVSGNILFPLTNYLYNRKNILSSYQNHINSEHINRKEISELQLKKIKNILRYAEENVPYYHSLFKKIGFHSSDFKQIDDLKSIPPLSRQDLIENRHQIVDRKAAKYAMNTDTQDRNAGAPVNMALFKKSNIVRNTSSGSTGAPTVFYEDGSVTAQNWSNELRVYSWFGLKPGVKQARFVRVTTDYNFESKSNRMRLNLWNQMILPGVNLQQKNYPWIIEKLNTFKPDLYWGFTSAITGLAAYIKENKIKNFHRPHLVVTWAAPLYEFEENLLSEIFQCHISNIYGMREVGHIGCTCPDRKMHLFQDNVYIEEDKTGELLVTPLYNSIMPFIRFRTGDLGSIDTESCSCGKTSNILKTFNGRTGEVFYTNDGRMISPNFWCRTFMDTERSQAVKRFQVLYKQDKSIEIKLVKTDLYNQNIERKFRNYLNENFGNDTAILFKEVTTLPSTLSGKYQMVLREQ